MIYIERKIIIKNNEATIEEPVVLYKGDRNIELQFTIENNPFKYKPGMDVTYGQLIIKRPSTTPIFSEPAKMSSSRVLFIVTGDMIDELVELGDYDFQIRLLNTDQSSRGSLPPVTAGITIKEPLYEEAVVNTASVNSERAVVMPANDGIMLLADDGLGGPFDADGNYSRTNWYGGDIITDSKLNKIEEALYQINDDIPTDYATEEYVDDSIVRTRNYIADNYATTTYVDDQRRATEAYAESYTNNAIGRLGLNDCATESFVTDSINSNNNYIESVILRDYVTDQELEDAINGIEGGGGNVDLTGYATEAYVDQALTNYPTIKVMKSTVVDYVNRSMPDIMEIRDSYLDNYFTEDDHKNGLCKAVLLSDVDLGGHYFRGELARMTLGWNKATSTRTATIESICGYTETYSIQEDGLLMRESSKSFATDDTINSILGKRNYATQDYVNEQIGDINAILDAINGEII